MSLSSSPQKWQQCATEIYKTKFIPNTTHFIVDVVHTFFNFHKPLSTEFSKQLDTKNFFWFQCRR